MKLIAISYPGSFNDEHIIINGLFNEGLEILHLRKPDWSRGDVAKLLDMIDAKFHNRIVLHSHYELYGMYNLMGIHFTRKTMHLIDLYKYSPIHKSISCHSYEEIDRYKHVMDYCFISPVFDSISKQGYKSAINLNVLEVYAQCSQIVALGGIDVTRLRDLQDINLYGAAMLGYLWNSESVIDAFLKAKQLCFSKLK